MPLSQDELQTIEKLKKMPTGGITPPSQPGMLESAARGAEQGATFGFGDEINGALSALAHPDDKLSILENYRKNRDESRAAMEAASNAHPYVYGAGNLAGAIAPALLTGGGSALAEGGGAAAKSALEMGAKYGALSGLGSSDADVTQGDLGQAAKDTLTGGITGAAIAPAVDAAGRAILPSLAKFGKNALETIGGLKPVEALTGPFEQGMLGRSTLGKVGKQTAEDIGLATAGESTQGNPLNYMTPVQERANALGEQKLGMLEQAAPLSPDDYLPWVQQAKAATANASKASNGTTGSGVATIDDLIDKTFFDKVPDMQGGMASVPKPQVSMMQLENFKRTIGDLGSAEFANGMKDPTAQALVNRLLSPVEGRPLNFQERLINIHPDTIPLTTFMENQVPGLSQVNKELSGMTSAINSAPSPGQVVTTGQRSLESADAMNKLFEHLKANPDVLESVQDRIADAQKLKNAVGTTNEAGLSKGIIGDTYRAVGGAVTNTAGRVLGGTGRLLGGLYEAAPDEVKKVAATVAARAKDLGPLAPALSNVLNQAAERDEAGRRALFFTIEQNPSYREILRKMSNEESPQQ